MLRSTLFLAGLCAALPLVAQAPITPDLHLMAVSAQGDFQSAVGSGAGISGGLSLTVPLTPRLAVRPRISYEQFPIVRNNYSYNSARYADRGFENEKWSAWSFGADCLFRPWGERGRFYILSGIFLKSWRLQSAGAYTTQDRLNSTRSYSVNDSSTSNEPGATAGLGFNLARWLSLECRMNLATYRKLSYNTFEAGTVFHF
jgi:hypothetical protein